MRPRSFGLTFFLLFQAVSVGAQEPSAAPSTAISLAFKQTEFQPARAGYVSLQWNDVLSSSTSGGTYVVRDQHDTIFYRGRLPMAFVSGLPDGEYRFDVSVMDADGNINLRSGEPAVLRVEHWSLIQALSLFAIGSIVFLTLIGVIVYGALDRSCARGTSGAVNR